MSRPNILVIGMAGAGKSTYLNDTFGSSFSTARSAKACTKSTAKFNVDFHGKAVTVWDCPGLFDSEVSLQEWSEEMLRSTSGVGFQQILFIVNATTRAGTLDALVITGLRCLLKNFSLDQGVTTVFTHCDAAPEYYQEADRMEWVRVLNQKCKLSQKGLPEISTSKTVAFVSKAKLEEKPDNMKQAKEKLQTQDVHGSLNDQAAKKIIPALESSQKFTPQKLGVDAGKTILREMTEVCGKDTVAEYVCYDAATSWVTKLDRASGQGEQVLALDINPGDKIIGNSLDFEEVLVKNVQHPKFAVMRKITTVSLSGNSSSMTLSFGHYVPVVQNGERYPKLMPSRDVQMGDILHMQTSGCLELARVTSIEEVEVRTTVSLRTRSLTMVVNGIVGSSRAEGDTGLLGHGLVLLAAMVITNGGQKLQNVAWAIEDKFHVVPLLRKLAIVL